MYKSINTLRSVILLAAIVFTINSFSQNKKNSRWRNMIDTTAKVANNMRCVDSIYKKNIKTVQLRDASFEMSQPILNLETQGTLVLNFDDFDGGTKNFMYTFIHCNADWTPDDLSTTEFIDGFADNVISDYKFSFNTIQRFTYYYVSFPNANIRFTKSGNYL